MLIQTSTQQPVTRLTFIESKTKTSYVVENVKLKLSRGFEGYVKSGHRSAGYAHLMYSKNISSLTKQASQSECCCLQHANTSSTAGR